MKPTFLLPIDLSGIINYNTFSVMPSIFNENTKNALFYSLCLRSLLTTKNCFNEQKCILNTSANLKNQQSFQIHDFLKLFFLPFQICQPSAYHCFTQVPLRCPMVILCNNFSNKVWPKRIHDCY